MSKTEAAYELGRAHERTKIAELARIDASFAVGYKTTSSPDATPDSPVKPTDNGSRKRPDRVAKAASNPKSSTRGKGVKARIASMIATAPLTVAEIIAHTGFKKTSVRATLASLKKEGLAIQDGNAWRRGWNDAHESGNSDGVTSGA
jgi:hypothetical protein